MTVFEIQTKVYLTKKIYYKEMFTRIGELVDITLSNNEKFLELHRSNCFKEYTFNGLYPLEKNKEYNEDKIYTFQIRTVNKDLAEYLIKEINNSKTDFMKVLKAEIKIIPKKHIDKIFSITPVIIKHEEGYWKGNLTLAEYEERIKINLIKKYKQITGEDIKNDFQLFSSLQFENRKPIGVQYKNIQFLGDKLTFKICDDEVSQMLAYMSLGTGLSELNARGLGFVNFRWL